MHNIFIEFATTYGVPIDTVTRILILPILVTMIAFFRQVIGIKAFGIYTPALMIFAFLEISTDCNSFWGGIKYGVTIFSAVIIIGTLARIVMKHFRLLYLPRVAIVITIVALTTLMLLIAGGMSRRTGLANVSIFPILIMITMVEKFVATQIEKGARAAVFLSLETLIISIVGYFVASWGTLISYLQAYPWIVLFTIGINIILGKWTGLRLLEYFRFKEVLKHVELDKKK